MPETSASMNRRHFLTAAATGAAVFAVSGLVRPFQALAAGDIILPALPYPMDALAPHISKRTLEFHYGKHHAGYVRKANAFLEGTDLKGLAIEQIIQKTAGDPALKNIFNNAAQVFNHTFYWHSMKPGGGGRPSGGLAEAVEKAFGGYEGFVKTFSDTAKGRFGSGWAWLAVHDGKLTVLDTLNADTPIAHGMTPLLTLDVWEHAYYLDYQNRRGDYVQHWLDYLVNWDFAADAYKAS
jgi:Fe-Mn family superoxide dismutase